MKKQIIKTKGRPPATIKKILVNGYIPVNIFKTILKKKKKKESLCSEISRLILKGMESEENE